MARRSDHTRDEIKAMCIQAGQEIIVEKGLANFFEKGSLAMVRNGKRSSSSTEFFFVTNKFPELDGRYSIFGKVVKGLEILDKIDEKDLIYEILIIN